MSLRTLCCLLVLTAGGAVALADDLADEVMLKLEDLGSPVSKERRAAEDELVALAAAAPANAERVLGLLPEANASMPQEVRAAVEKVRARIEEAVSLKATAASRVTIDVFDTPLAEVLAEFSRQTGVVLRDSRDGFGDAAEARVTLRCDNQPFWPAVDKLLDAAGLTVYPYGEEGELTLTPSDAGVADRVGAAAYAGPFRFEAVSASATRGLRDLGASRLDISVEASWEPRLRPIALSMPMEELIVTGSDGEALEPRTPEQAIVLESNPGEQATTMTLSMQLPERKVERVERIAGRMSAMIPATPHEFRVERVGATKLPLVQEFGDAVVTLEAFRKVNAIWELHMRVRLADPGDSLASHRGWVFRNKSYLVDAEGKRIEHAGFETTLQTTNEIGVAYLFDLSGGPIYGFAFDEAADEPDGASPDELDPESLAWVYETATGVYTVPVEWELGPIDLP